MATKSGGGVALVIKRQEIPQTEEYLFELLAKDSIQRNAELLAFLEILDEIDGAYSVFLDGKWGSGKTIFIKQAILILQSLHGTYKEKIHKKNLDTIGNAIADFVPTHSYLPFYYNAWENDVYSDSIVTLLGALIAESETESFGKIPPETMDKITAIADALLKPFGFDITTTIKEGFTSQDLLKSMKDIRAVEKNICELIDLMLEERADKLILFVDELDRCSPAFAIQLLEKIKFIFDMENVVVVFSTNMSQLTHTVESFYGAGINGSEYLTRFYDLKLELMDVKPSDFLTLHGFPYSSDFYDTIAREIANAISFSMRDCLIYLQEINRVKEVALSKLNDAAARLLAGGLAPVIVAVKISDSELYRNIMSGIAANELFELASKSPTFIEYLEKCKGLDDNSLRLGRIEYSTPEKFYHAVYQESFGVELSDYIGISMFSWDNKSALLNKLFGITKYNSD